MGNGAHFKRGKNMKVGMLISVCLWVGIAVVNTGCAGLELGGKLGVYRVDEKSESQATRRDMTKPLKCWLMDCSNQDHDDVRGS